MTTSSLLKELKLLCRDLHGLAVLFVMPIAFMLIMSLALSRDQDPHTDSRIALVPQDHSTALHPLIAVGRQIALASQAAGRTRDEADERATDYLYAVGLDESFADRVPGRLSGGQRQRVSLALALAAEPALIIADEPTTALDVVARAEILRLLSSLTSLPQAPALLLITHDLPAAAICENIAVLHDGAIIESGETRPVLTRPEHPVTAAMCEAGAEETIDGALAAAGAAA